MVLFGAPACITSSSSSTKVGIHQSRRVIPKRAWLSIQCRRQWRRVQGCNRMALEINSMGFFGPAIAYCVTLIKSLPSAFCLWFIHWDFTFFKFWLIYYFCSASDKNAAPLLACASQYHCDTTIVLRRRPTFFHIRIWLILLLLISKWTHIGNSEMPGLQLII